MKLLPSVSVRRLRTLPPGTGFTLAVCGCLVGLEVLGRLVASDLQDVLGVFALIGLGLTVALRHRREPLPWVRGLTGWVRRVAGNWAAFSHEWRGQVPAEPVSVSRVQKVCGRSGRVPRAAKVSGWRGPGARPVRGR